MKREYDFSKAIRGRFYKKDALLRIPIYLDTNLQKQVQRIAQDKGKNIEEVVSEFLKKELSLPEALIESKERIRKP
jgi:cytidylate kinase